MSLTRRSARKKQEETMNKNLAFAVIGGLVAIGLIGSVVLHVLRPDTVAAFMPNVITLLGLIITAAGTIYGLGKVNDKLDGVHRNTNGTLSALQKQIEDKDNVIREQADRMLRMAEKLPPGA